MPLTKDEKTREQVISRYNAASSVWGAYHKRIQKWIKLYLGDKSENNTVSLKSNLFINLILPTIESVIPSLMMPFLDPSQEFLQVNERLPWEEQNAKANKELLLFQTDTPEFFQELNDFFRQVLICGHSVGQIFWDSDQGQPVFESCDLQDIFIDPDAKSIKKARYLIKRTLNVSPEWLLEMESTTDENGKPYFRNVRKIPQVRDYLNADYPAQEDTYTRYSYDDIKPETSDGIELLEYFENDRYVVIADETYVLRDVEGLFWHCLKPFVEISFISLWFRWQGLGITELLEDPQLEMNKKRNQRMDNVELTLNRMWLLENGAIPNPGKQLVSAPGRVIKVNNINGIKALDTADVTASGVQAEQDLRQDMKTISGVTDEYAGRTEVRHEQTRGEVYSKLQQAVNRLVYYAKLMYSTGVREIYEHFHMLNCQFIQQPQLMRILGPKGKQWKYIAPQDINKRYDIRITLDDQEVIKSQKRQDLLTFQQNLGQLPAVIQDPNIQFNLFEKLVKSFAYDLEDFTKISPLAQQYQQQQMMMQQQAMQQQQQQPKPNGGQPA